MQKAHASTECTGPSSVLNGLPLRNTAAVCAGLNSTSSSSKAGDWCPLPTSASSQSGCCPMTQGSQDACRLLSAQYTPVKACRNAAWTSRQCARVLWLGMHDLQLKTRERGTAPLGRRPFPNERQKSECKVRRCAAAA
ncbi:hypothetical protein C8T65DRAFT_645245 [Cerioporus squamosus]|nr:hypothetical protein C8T65DRAFT_645245 [Cerioporus squamosus]